MTKQRTDIAVIVALTEEFQQLLQLLSSSLEPIKDDKLGGYSYRFLLPTPQGTYSCSATLVGEMGPGKAGRITSHLIEQSAPRTIAMVGIAAGIDKELRLGDVVSARQVDAYLATTKAVAKSRKGFNLLFRGSAYTPSHHLLQETIHLPFAFRDKYLLWQRTCREDLDRLVSRRVKKRLLEADLLRNEPQLTAVHLASGPVLSSTDGFTDWLKTRDEKLAAVEMEAAGVIAAVYEHQLHVETIVLRGISDFGDSRKPNVDQIGSGAMRRYAMRNVVRLLLAMASQGLFLRGKVDSNKTNQPSTKRTNSNRVRLAAESSLLETKMALKTAYAQKRELEFLAADTASVETQILLLRRRIREIALLQPGFFLENGRYELIEQLGSGGYGIVWRAFDHGNEITVAIKSLHDRWAADASKRVRFFRGARVMFRLSHPHIVKVLQPKGSDPPYLYFVMEHVRFGTLEAGIRSGLVDIETGLKMLVHIGNALHHAHSQGYVHRDVKPSNILIAEDFRAKLCDFDLVMAEDTTGGTQFGQMGTIAFCAPEMITKPFDADARSDVFSLGRIAIFVLDAANYHFPSLMSDAYTYIENLKCSDSLKYFLQRSVADQPRMRIQTAAEFARELEQLISEKRIRKERIRHTPVKFMQQLSPTWAGVSGDVDEAT